MFKLTHKIKNLFFVLLCLSSVNNYADDIDILNTETLVDANILFVMDLSGSMNTQIDGSTATRLEELRGAFQNIIDDDNFSKVNFGLSMFSGNAQSSRGAGLAHGITYPVSPIVDTPAQDILSKPDFTHPSNSYMPAAGTNNTRQYLSLLSSDTNIWSANGSTPIVDALFEASRYFRGEEVLWGKYPADDIRSAHPSTYAGTISSVSTTITPACTAESRISCNSGSCGATESCTVSNKSRTRSDPAGGTNCNTNTGRRCSTTTSDSCGLGSNCSAETVIKDRFCNSSISTISDCMTAKPTWNNCTTYTSTSCTTNSEEQSICSDDTRVRCEEEVTKTTCDAADTYTCDFPVENCTMCPEDEIATTIAGNAVYKSPITQECAANGIILLTDGAPTQNRSADDVVTMIGSTYANNCNTGTEYGRCGPELAKFMSEEDHADGSRSVPNIDGLQNVKTYAVGLALDLTIPEQAATKVYLDNISMNGNGSPAIIAGNKEELTEAFITAINSVVGKARSFASPSYSVDTTNLLSHGDDVYVPIFDRKGTVWPGNLKKYKLVAGVLTDADDKAATDADGVLLADARDLWSADPSTDVVTSGGAANKLNPSTRNIKSDDGTDLIALNANIDNGAFGLGSTAADTALKADLVKFIKGINPEDDSVRYHMGDIIHSKPVKLNRATGGNTIFVGTNEGYLHGIQDTDGTENFAFMPRELLTNIKDQYANTATPKHIYGVDGPITLWIDERATASDVTKYENNVLDAGEKAYLFFGLRRGGKHYYALDVTTPGAPSLVWKKAFGATADQGDSWSQPVVKMLKLGVDASPVLPVLILGGGYNEDVSTGAQIAGGNAVYIVDAINASTTDATSAGDVIWSTKIAEASTALAPDTIDDGVPSKIRALDIDRNGSIDRLYFADTGGNIWRVDLNASNYDINTVNNDLTQATMRKVAELGGAGANNRKFFEETDVAIFRRAGKIVASIAIGSGDRTKPLDATIDDRFFVIYDKEVMIKPTKTTIAMTNLIASSDVDATELAKSTFVGWHKDLTSSNGEKVLSSAITYQNKVIFTTFGTTSVTPDACNPGNTNVASLYIMDLVMGTEDYNQVKSSGEILGTPQIVIGELKNSTGGACADTDYNCEREDVIRVGRAAPVPFPVPTGGAAIPNALPRVYWLDNEEK